MVVPTVIMVAALADRNFGFEILRKQRSEQPLLEPVGGT